jgi:hypothetical protein
MLNLATIIKSFQDANANEIKGPSWASRALFFEGPLVLHLEIEYAAQSSPP